MNSWIHEFMNSWKHESCRHKCLVVKLISLSRFLKVWRHTWFPNLQCNLLMLQNGVISHHYLNFASPDLHAPWWVMNSWKHESCRKHTFILSFYLYNSMSLWFNISCLQTVKGWRHLEICTWQDCRTCMEPRASTNSIQV